MMDSRLERKAEQYARKGPGKHGGKRTNRKREGLDLVKLSWEVSSKHAEWVLALAEAHKISGGEALDRILARDLRRAQAKAEKGASAKV